MGAWGTGTFENDTACDWAYGLEDVKDLSLVDAALAAVNEADDDFLDADLACEALAACEVIARLKGQWGARDAYTETLDAWVKAHPQNPGPERVKNADAAITRILADSSELRELWEEDDASQWIAAVEELRARVKA
jgi:hypothetical protein